MKTLAFLPSTSCESDEHAALDHYIDTDLRSSVGMMVFRISYLPQSRVEREHNACESDVVALYEAQWTIKRGTHCAAIEQRMWKQPSCRKLVLADCDDLLPYRK